MIRPYQDTDFDILVSWWGNDPSCPRSKEDVPPNTFIIEYQGKPAASLALLTTDWKQAAWAEMLIADPKLSRFIRRALVNSLFSHIETEARKLGYRSIVLFSYVDKLKSRYSELGYVPTLSNVTTFAKSL